MPSRAYVSIADAAEYLGVTTRTIRQMIADGRLRGYRSGHRLVRLRLEEIGSRFREPREPELTCSRLVHLTRFPVPYPYMQEPGTDDEKPLYVDISAMLDGTVPEPPEPVLLRRSDGRKLFYAGQVNLLFGDPEIWENVDLPRLRRGSTPGGVAG